MTTTNTMSYKGYTARIQYDDDDAVFYGDLVDLADVITFSGSSVTELREGFHASVDSYLQWCEERGKEPDRPYSGKVQLRFAPSLHRDAAVLAARMKLSLNTFIVQGIEKQVHLARAAMSSPRPEAASDHPPATQNEHVFSR